MILMESNALFLFLKKVAKYLKLSSAANNRVRIKASPRKNLILLHVNNKGADQSENLCSFISGYAHWNYSSHKYLI